MPVIVQIDGVGEVELDDSFSQMDAAQQEATIAKIVSQAKGSRTAPPPQQQPPAMQGDMPQADPLAGFPPPADPNIEYGDGWYPHAEEDYQNSLKATGVDPKAPPAPKPEAGSDFFYNPFTDPDRALSDLSKGTGNVVEGIMDLPAIVGNPLNAGINSIFGTNLSTDLSGTAREGLGLEKDDSLAGEIQRGIAGGLTFSGAAASAGKQAGNVVQKGLYELGKTPVRDAVAGGSASAAADITRDLGGGPLAQTMAALAGGTAGFKSGDALMAATPTARAERFAAKQLEKNPFAAYDAEVVSDIASATRDRAVAPTDPKGRAAVSAKTLNSVEQRYFAEYKNAISKLDIPEADKLKLKAGLSGKYALGNDEIASLREMGVPGQAVADAVVKTQRLRALTPEIKGKPGFLGRAADVMDFIPGIPGIIPRGVRAVGRASGDGEAARVNAAEKLLKKEKAYQKLGMKAGPSGAKESNEALWDAVRQTVAAKEQEAVKSQVDKLINPTVTKADRAEFKNTLDSGATAPLDETLLEAAARRKDLKKAFTKMEGGSEKQLAAFDEALAAPPAPPKEARITAKDRSDFRQQISDPDRIDPRDTSLPEARTLAQISRTKLARDSAIAKMEGSMSDFDAKLADPSTAPQPKATRQATPDPVDRMVEMGIPGEFRALDSLSNSTGMSRDDATRVLQSVKEDFPELGREIDRVVAGHNTTKKLGPTLRPAMQAKMRELGIQPKSPSAAPLVPIDEAAQARLSAIDPRTIQEAAVDVSQITKREVDLLEELDKVDPIRMTSGNEETGVMEYSRDSAMGPEWFRPDDAARAQEIRAELKAIGEERSMRSVQRPQQWADGKNRYQSQANSSIDRMMQDGAVSQSSMDAIGNAPVQIRDNFKTVEEAENFIISRIIPDLEASGVPAAEINRVRSYLFEIAQAKPYSTREAYEAGTSYRRPGRPSN